MLPNPLLLASMLTVAVGGLAFVLVSGDSRAKKRQDALQKGSVKSKDAALDKSARRKQIADSLKELDQKAGRRKITLETKIEQAGLLITRQQYFLLSGASALMVGLLTFLFTHSPYISAPAAVIVGGFGLPSFVLSWLRKRRISKFVNEFPNAMDVVVRGVKAGLPLGDCLRIIANEAQEPVRGEFRKIVEAQALGLSLGEAVDRLPERVPVTEANFFAIVINIQAKAGGNLSEALGNLSRVLRERKKMKGKIGAMSMEAKASAVIIGIIPFAVTTMLYFSSPKYVSLLWTTTHGEIIASIGLFWMSIGTAIMKKMITFDF